MSRFEPPKWETEHNHNWVYDNGATSSEQEARGGRMCTVCRFRENLLHRLGITKCFGGNHLYQFAYAEGHVSGMKSEKTRIKTVLGLW